MREVVAPMPTPFERARLPLGRRPAVRSTGRPPGRLRVPVERAIDHCRVFVGGRRLPGEFTPGSALAETSGRGEGFVWLGLQGPDEDQMQKIAAQFGIHELIVEDVVSAHQRPKVERYDDQLFIVVRSVTYADKETVSNTRQIIETGEVQMVLGPDFIITIRHGTVLPRLDLRLEEDPELCAMGPSAMVWAVADHLVEEYGRISTLLSEEVDRLEEEVFTPGSRFNIEQIYTLKREILEMRHAIAPLVPALRSLTTDNKDLLGKQLRSYFRDVMDNGSIAADQVAGFDERLSSLIDASVAKITLQQNSDMRTISAVVGMAAAPTLIAGIYGMNFDHMPELHWEYGYYVVLGVIVLIVGLLWWWFRRKNWL